MHTYIHTVQYPIGPQLIKVYSTVQYIQSHDLCVLNAGSIFLMKTTTSGCLGSRGCGERTSVNLDLTCWSCRCPYIHACMAWILIEKVPPYLVCIMCMYLLMYVCIIYIQYLYKVCKHEYVCSMYVCNSCYGCKILFVWTTFTNNKEFLYFLL